MRLRLPLLTALPIALAISLGCAAPTQQVAPAKNTAPSPLPRAVVVTLAGEPTDLATVVRGRVALVSLWATWCDACATEMDALNRLDAGTSSRGDAVVVGVAVGEPRAKVAEFAKQRGLSYAQLVDEEFHFADALGQRRIPATLVVDRQGRVVFRGEALDAQSLAAFRRALASVE